MSTGMRSKKKRWSARNPALSQRREIGTPLFERSARGMELLPSGEAFLAHARSILAAVADAGDAARRAAVEDDTPPDFLNALRLAEIGWPRLSGRFGFNSRRISWTRSG